MNNRNNRNHRNNKNNTSFFIDNAMRHDTSNTDPPRAFGRPLTHPDFPAKQEFPLEGTPMARGGQCRNVPVSGLVFKALVELRVAVCSAPVGQRVNQTCRRLSYSIK